MTPFLVQVCCEQPAMLQIKQDMSAYSRNPPSQLLLFRRFFFNAPFAVLFQNSFKHPECFAL